MPRPYKPALDANTAAPVACSLPVRLSPCDLSPPHCIATGGTMGAIFQQVGRLDETWMLGLASRRVPRWLDAAFRWGTHLGGASATLFVGLILALIPATREAGMAALIANSGSHVV